MPHSRFDWANRIKAAEREYHAVRVAVDWLLQATPDEVHDITDARGWDDLAATDGYAADRNLDARTKTLKPQLIRFKAMEQPRGRQPGGKHPLNVARPPGTGA